MSWTGGAWLHYRGIGRWCDALLVDLLLGLLAKSALAWQVCAGTLAGA